MIQFLKNKHTIVITAIAEANREKSLNFRKNLPTYCQQLKATYFYLFLFFDKDFSCIICVLYQLLINIFKYLLLVFYVLSDLLFFIRLTVPKEL